jgi:DNA polymerase-3 subunit delta
VLWWAGRDADGTAGGRTDTGSVYVCPVSAGSLFLIKGDDVSLISRAVQELVDSLVGDGDRSLLVEELNETAYRTESGDYSIAPLVDAAQTPPFLTDHRVVVGREIGRFSKTAEVQPLLDYLADPLSTTHLVLVWEKGPELQRLNATPKPLTEAVTQSGEIVDVKVPRGKAAQGWLEEQVAAAGVTLDRDAMRALADHLGEDRGRLPAVLDTLASTFGDSARLGRSDVEPYLGEAGDVAPWELTDAIASGDVAGAIDRVHRMQAAGGRHALQILASLHAHYARLLRLDGSGLHDEKAAAQALGMKGSTFPAKKALQQARALGTARVARAISMLATADLDVRGATAVADETTMEVLVARLATLHR